MKKGWIISIVVIIIIICSSFIYFNKKANRGTEVKTALVSKGEIVSYFSTSGTLESKNKKEYYAPGMQKVTGVNVKVGDKVKKGDTMVSFETQDFSIQLKTAQMQYDNTKIQLENLKKIRDNTGAAQSQENGQAGNLGQGSNLQGSTAMSIDDQIKVQENQLEIARLNIESVKQNIGKQQGSISSDFDGVVTAVNVKAGSTANTQAAVVVVEDIANLQVVVNVNQYDVVNVKKGQEALIKFNGSIYKGAVSSIDPVASKSMTTSGTDTSVKAVIDLLEGGDILKSGYDVDVDIKIGEKKDILKTPAEAIMTDKENRETVYVFEADTARLKEIQTGISSDMETEITSGLKEGDRVIINPPTTLRDEIRVTEKSVK